MIFKVAIFYIIYNSLKIIYIIILMGWYISCEIEHAEGLQTL